MESATVVKGMGIGKKLTVSLFILALVPIVATLSATLTTSQPQMERLATDNLRGVVQAYRGSVEQWEEQNHAFGKQAASDFARFGKDDEKGQKAFLQSIVRNAGIVTAWATDPDGNQIVRDNDGKLSNINERKYFRDAHDNGLGGMEVAFSKSTGKYTTLAGYRYQPESGRLFVLGINWDPAFFKKAADRLSLGKSGKAAIISGEGLFVHTTDAKAGQEADKSLVAQLPSGDDAKLFDYKSPDGERWIVAASSDGRRGLRYVVMQLHDEAFGPVETLKVYAAWGGSVALLFAVVFAAFLRRTFAAPVVEVASVLRVLAEKAEKQPSDLWKLNVPHTGKLDEIGSIARRAETLQEIIYAAFLSMPKGEKNDKNEKGGE